MLKVSLVAAFLAAMAFTPAFAQDLCKTIPSPPNTGGGTLVKGAATIVAAFGSASKDKLA